VGRTAMLTSCRCQAWRSHLLFSGFLFFRNPISTFWGSPEQAVG
jgi:hypothetical protein